MATALPAAVLPTAVLPAAVQPAALAASPALAARQVTVLPVPLTVWPAVARARQATVLPAALTVWPAVATAAATARQATVLPAALTVWPAVATAAATARQAAVLPVAQAAVPGVVPTVAVGVGAVGVGAAGPARTATTSGAPATEGGYAWPLRPPPTVLTPFSAPDNPFGPGHRGVDLAGTVGQPVWAARAGTVVFAGPVAGVGVVSVQHDDGLRTTYEPVAPVVAAGVTVATGALLGTLLAGHHGCPTACLHWGVLRDRLDYVDPLVLLRPRHVRLLPVPATWPEG